MDLLVSKVSSLFILAFSTTLAAILPLKLKKLPVNQSDNKSKDDDHQGRRDRIMNAILAFSGGVLLSTVFIHLMPDVNAEFDAALSPGRNGIMELTDGDPIPGQSFATFLMGKMPWGQLAICLGFFLIYALEEIVEYFYCRSCENEHHHHNDSTFDSVETRRVNAPTGSTTTSGESATGTVSVKYKSIDTSTTCISTVHATHGAHREPHQLRDCNKRSYGETAIGFDEVNLDEKTPLFQASEDSKNCRDERSGRPSCSGRHAITWETAAPKVKHEHSHEEDDQHSEHASQNLDNGSSALQDVRNTMRGIMLIVALSFHSVFEGMAIGLQSTIGGVWTSFAAVALHKLVMAFCAGVELVQLGTKMRTYFMSMITFSLVCPIGIAIGTIVTEIFDSTQSSETPSLPIASLQGLACGTLLYVTFFEVLTRTRGNELSSLINFVAVLCGFALITGFHLLD